jgi:AcrR family transcriptional regulator
MASQPISFPATLSPAQMKVVAALAQGASVAEAARAAGVHRSTVYTWLESEPDFVTAVQESRAEFAQYLRAELRQLTTLAISTLRQLLENADTPPALKLRAANAVLQAGVRYQVTEHPPQGYLLEDWYFAELGLKAEAKAPQPEAGAARPESGAAVEPLRVARGAVGRNSPCPCGSAQKYKRCCGKNAPPLLHAA